MTTSLKAKDIVASTPQSSDALNRSGYKHLPQTSSEQRSGAKLGTSFTSHHPDEGRDAIFSQNPESLRFFQEEAHRMKKGTFGQANQESPDSQLYLQPSTVTEDYNYRTPPTSAFGQKKQVPCATIQLPIAKQQ